MIGDLIPEDSEHWQLYIYLRKIMGILTSPKLDKAQIETLKELIHDHNVLYVKIIGPLKPKMHLLTHYIRIIQLIGPIIHFSTLKFERQNKKLKEVASGTTSNLNLPLTIMTRIQLQFCYNVKFTP